VINSIILLKVKLNESERPYLKTEKKREKFV